MELAITKFIVLILLAAISGYIEELVMRDFTSPGPRLFGFSIPYHFPIGALWIGICWIAGYWWFAPVFMLIEDITWYLCRSGERLRPGVWVTLGLGGVKLGKTLFIPTTYLVALAIAAVLWWVDVRIFGG